MKFSQSAMAEFLSTAVDAAQRGALELERWRARFAVKEKSRADLVTDADHASQRIIRETLLAAFPDHHFLGEEDSVGRSHEETRLAADAPPTWIVDPLDGTANYVHDVPAYCVSIGLFAEGKPLVGVNHDPRLHEVFTAAHGMGAFLNGSPIHVSPVAALRDGLISTGFPADIQKQLRNFEAWGRVMIQAQALRRTGSTALNLAYVAAGRFDGYWAYDNYPWDVIAGAVLVTEAGGTITSADGGPFDPFSPDLVATNGRFHGELLRVLTEK